MTILKAFYSDILDRYLYRAAETLEKFRVSGDKFHFRCNVCGDHKKSSGSSASILKNKDPWMFHCFNCSTAIPAEYWLKSYFNDLYRDYSREAFKLDVGVKSVSGVIENNARKAITAEKARVYDENEDTKYFTGIMSGDGELFIKARSLCVNRMIPDKIWHNFYVSTAKHGLFAGRLIIPFYDNHGKVYNWQARDLSGKSDVKYVGRKRVHYEFENIYNIFNVDLNKPVVITEGMIDSMFIENSVAMTGIKPDSTSLSKISDKLWIPDNDNTGKKLSIELLNRGEKVFNWKKYLYDKGIPNRIKDINEVIMHTKNPKTLTTECITHFFTNSKYDKLNFII